MKNALAVYSGARAVNGQKLFEIALDGGMQIRFLAGGGYIPSNPEEIASKALSGVNGGFLLLVGGIDAKTDGLAEFDAWVASGDRKSITAMLSEGKVPWCEFYTGTFDYEKAIARDPKEKPKLDGAVASQQLSALKKAKTRYIIYNQSRRKNGDELMQRLAAALAAATTGIVAKHSPPSR